MFDALTRAGLLALVLGVATEASAQAISETMSVRPLTELNSAADDYAPVYDTARQQLVLASDRTGAPLLYAAHGAGPSFDAVQREGGEINRNGHPCAFLTISANGEAYSARYIMRENRSYVGIVSVGREQHGFACGQPLAIVNGDHFASHPAISPDGTMLV